jgi:hypothetical protein
MQFAPQGISYYSIKFKDFVPAQLSRGGLFSPAHYETLEKLLADIDEWIEQNPEIMIVNIETVVLPNIHHQREEGSEDPELSTREMDGVRNKWHQFFRVWYK